MLIAPLKQSLQASLQLKMRYVASLLEIDAAWCMTAVPWHIVIGLQIALQSISSGACLL